MVRLSDILKKKIQTTPSPEEVKSTPFNQAHQAVSKKEQIQESSQQPAEMQLAKVMREMQPDIERSKALYSGGVQLAKETLGNVREKKPLDAVKIKDLVAHIIDYLVLGDKELLNLFYEYSTDNYLYNHMVNVSIMAVYVGLGLGYNKSRLNELGLAAFLHDIGMIKVENVALQPRTLSEEEHNQIKEHPLCGAEILSKIKDIPGSLISVAKEEHERMDGRGYPCGIKGTEISEYARIIATIDVYEALTHKRSYRNKYLPHEAIKEILNNGSSLFDPVILRTLINRVGIYPIGSWVELNTSEIGKVVTNNDEFPLKPIVNLIFDSAGNKPDETRAVNLAKQFNLFIKKPLSDEEVLKKNNRGGE